MKQYPIFLSLSGQRVIMAGGGLSAIAKLRLLLKTEAEITVHASCAHQQIQAWAREGKITLLQHPIVSEDLVAARLVYAANDDAAEDARVAELGRASGALVNIVDDLSSDFFTAAMVDRDPVTIAIGTEGTAPVLSRKIKAELESWLSSDIGKVAAIAGSLRPIVADLPARVRSGLWRQFWDHILQQGSVQDVHGLFKRLLNGQKNTCGSIALIGAGPGDPELLTLRARKLLDVADTVLHDSLVSSEVLELARREAEFIVTDQTHHGNDLMISRARKGEHIVRLIAGDPSSSGFLEADIAAFRIAGIEHHIVAGIPQELPKLIIAGAA